MRSLITAICVATATAGLAAQSATGQSSGPSSNPAAHQDARAPGEKPLTVTGCLQPAQNQQNAFQLLVPEARQSTTNAKAVTTAYTLTPAGGVDLQAHVNEMVELSGSELPAPTQTATVVDQSKSQSQPTAVGTSGSGSDNQANAAKTTPVVETTARAEIVSKAMSVTSVKTVATRCQ